MFTPSKPLSSGPDSHIEVELPLGLKEKAERAAEAAGMTVEEFVRRVLAEKVGELELERRGDWLLTASETRVLMELATRRRPDTRRFRSARRRARSLFGRREM